MKCLQLRESNYIFLERRKRKKKKKVHLHQTWPSIETHAALINKKGDGNLLPLWSQVRAMWLLIWWPLEAYMVVNFRAHGISRGAHKLVRTSTLNSKKKKTVIFLITWQNDIFKRLKDTRLLLPNQIRIRLYRLRNGTKYIEHQPSLKSSCE